MTDNVRTSAGTNDGVTFATDEESGTPTIHHPYVKLEFGADNTFTKVSTSNPLPVVQTGTHTVTGAGGSFPVTDSGGSLTVDNGGTFVVQENGAALTALQLIDNASVAHDAAAVSGVTQMGMEARSTANTAVADGDATRAIATLLGKQVVMPYAIPAASEAYASPAAVTDTADDAAFAAGGAGIRHYITGVQVFNGHDTVGTEVVIKDGSTVLWRGWAEQTGGGCSAVFSPPLRGTANTAVNVANITTGSSTYFNLQGFTAAE